MTTGTVKSTQAAVDAIQRMLNQVNGGLTDAITQFKADGEIVNDPNNYEGPAAAGFRSEWGGVKSALETTITQLNELADNIRQVNSNIQTAGGNQ
jgi:uncharacterized protein YukE